MAMAGIMNIAVLFLFAVMAQQCLGQELNCPSLYNRYPANSDITVNCGPSNIELTILACPVQFAMFNPANLSLNGKHSSPNCAGQLDTTVNPAVVKFLFPLNDTTENSCGNTIVVESTASSGAFVNFINVQTVVISGFVDTPPELQSGIIAYSTNLNYSFSCHYPLMYLLNNTELLTSSANVAINTNNGSFINTLSMQLYADESFVSPLQLNGSALPLKKNVYVQVALKNLTANFYVLLDRCFATPSPLYQMPSSDTMDLLMACTPKNKTRIYSNGNGTVAQFSFETFRFLEHSSQAVSTIYVHCYTRLCQPQTCQTYLQSCTTRRRRAAEGRATEGTSEEVTLSSGPILTKESTQDTSSQISSSAEVKQLEGSLTGLIVGLLIAVLLGIALVIASVILYRMYRLRGNQTEKSGVDTFNGK